MNLIRVAGFNIDVTVGAFTSNFRKLLTEAAKAGEAGATIAATSEMVLCGYPSEDLVQWQAYVSKQWKLLQDFAKIVARYKTVFVVGLAVHHNGSVYNCAAVVHGGVILGVVPKEKLPTYNVFYDLRTFATGTPGMRGEVCGVPFGDLIFTFDFGTMAVEICEDGWSPDGPMKRRVYAGADIVVNISASPWRSGVVATRREMLATRSSDNYTTVLYVNGVGGMDSLVFDGGGFIHQNGRLLMEAKRWECDAVWEYVVDLDRARQARVANTTHRLDAEAYRRSGAPMPHVITSNLSTTFADNTFEYPVPESKSFLMPHRYEESKPFSERFSEDEYFEDLVEAMVMGLSGYFEKTGVFKSLLIALSGGRDSALTLLLAYIYAERRFARLPHDQKTEEIKKFIRCVSMPTTFNSETTRSIARDLCSGLGVSFAERPIQDAFGRELTELCEQLDDQVPDAITIQNSMPRIRMTRMQNLSNATGAMLLHCGNMTERAAGYGTIGGDFTAGAYSLLGNLPKSVIRELITYLHNTRFNYLTALSALIASEESAELAENQRDEDDLGPIVVLDACITLFYGEKQMPDDVYRVVRGMWTDAELLKLYPGYKAGMLKEWVKRFVRMSYRSTFKWVVAPQAVHLGSLDLDRERALQIPVVKSTEWLEEALQAIDALP